MLFQSRSTVFFRKILRRSWFKFQNCDSRSEGQSPSFFVFVRSPYCPIAPFLQPTPLYTAIYSGVCFVLNLQSSSELLTHLQTISQLNHMQFVTSTHQVLHLAQNSRFLLMGTHYLRNPRHSYEILQTSWNGGNKN